MSELTSTYQNLLTDVLKEPCLDCLIKTKIIPDTLLAINTEGVLVIGLLRATKNGKNTNFTPLNHQ